MVDCIHPFKKIAQYIYFPYPHGVCGGIMVWSEDTFVKLAYLQDVNQSSDGGRVAYVLRKANLEENRYENTVVIEDLHSKSRRYVEDATMPRFSPDGKKMLYLRVDEDKKKSDLYLLDVESMSAKRLVEAKRIVSVDWHSDSRRVLILISKKLDDEDLWYDNTVPVWFNGKGFRDNERFIFQIYDVEGETVVDEFEDYNVENAMWHGDAVIYTTYLEEHLFMYYTIKIYDGKKRILLEKVPYIVADTDGQRILLHGRKDRRKISQHWYLYIYDGERIVDVNEKFGLNTEMGKISEDGSIYGLVARRGSLILEKYSSGEKTEIAGEGGYVYSFDVSRGKVAFLMMRDTEPGELYIYDGKTRKITSYNSEILRKLKPLKHNHFKFKSFDGKEIDAWYIRPRGRKKAPLILFVHGGPKGMYGYYFHYNAQLMASRGYYVLMVNPRGSNGYSEEFALDVLERTGLEDFRDIMEALDNLLLREKRIDSGRMGITGISYGGFMTNWAITQTDRFKAAISEQGISYWLTSYAFSDIGLWFDREVIGDNPLNNENYRKLSPLFYADRVSTPVLFIHSMEDYRCPLDQSLMFHNILISLGKESHIVVFKNGDHGHSVRGKPRQRLKRYRIFVDFFEKKLNDEEFRIEKVLGGCEDGKN